MLTHIINALISGDVTVPFDMEVHHVHFLFESQRKYNPVCLSPLNVRNLTKNSQYSKLCESGANSSNHRKNVKKQ